MRYAFLPYGLVHLGTEIAMSGEAENEGIRIVLSPVQLAAVLENEALVAGATIGNRLIGALRLLGCGAEAAGAAALAGAPEPTLLSKVGSIALAAHAADQCTSGGMQLWSGRAASAVARNLGAGPEDRSDHRHGRRYRGAHRGCCRCRARGSRRSVGLHTV
jgi:hypothetical protein